MRGVDIRLVTI